MRLHSLKFPAALAGALISITAAAAAAPALKPVATYDTRLGESGAEIISIRETDGIAALSNVAGSIDVLDLSNPEQPGLLRRIQLPAEFGAPNSVAVHPRWDFLLAVSGSAGSVGTVAAWRVSDGTLLAQAAVGIQPDSIAIAPNGQYAVVANEAESTGQGQSGGPGSLSIVDLTRLDRRSDPALLVTPVALPSAAGLPNFSTGRTDDLGRLPIDNAPDTLEPESVAFSTDSRFAYVTLQENSGVARLEVRSGEVTYLGVGRTAHAADTKADGAYDPADAIDLYREPDGIGLSQDGQLFFTADEGDTRDGGGRSGVRGGRTVSVFDARTGAFLGDTGRQIDDATAAAGIYPDGRSNRGGSEPEVLDVTHDAGLTLVAVGLERGNAVALIDATVPSDPRVIAVQPVGLAPEGTKFFRRNGRLFVATANEVSGTVSIVEVVR